MATAVQVIEARSFPSPLYALTSYISMLLDLFMTVATALILPVEGL